MVKLTQLTLGLLLGGLVSVAVANAETTTPVAAPATGNGVSVNAQTAMKVEEAKPAPKAWTATILNETWVGAADLHRNEYSGAQAAGFLGVSYKLNDSQSVAVRQNFMMNMSDPDTNGEFAIDDTSFHFTDRKAFRILEQDFVHDVRLYVPVSEYSRNTGKIEGRYTVSFNYAVADDGKLTLSHLAGLRVYGYTEDKSGQDGLRGYLSTTLGYQATSNFKPYASVLYNPRWYHTGSGPVAYGEGAVSDRDDNRDRVYTYLGADLSLSPISIGAYLEHMHDLRSAANYVFAEEDKTTYYLALSASM